MIAALLDPAHYFANPVAIGPLATSMANGLLGLIVYVRQANGRASRAFFLLTSAASLWLGAFGAMCSAKLETIAKTWGMLGMIGVIMIPPAVYSLTATDLDIVEKHAVVRLSNMWRATILFLQR